MPGFMSLWSQTAADNDDADTTINWAEGQTPGSVNNSARALMASVASWRADNNGTLSTTGSANAYVISTNEVHAALANGQTVSFRANHSNTSTATLNVNSLGAKAIRAQGDVALAAGALISGGHYKVQYNSSANSAAGAWMLTNASRFPLVPVASDGEALGSASLPFSDLFLASGSVINFNNGDVAVTHSANTLTFTGASGGYFFDAALVSSSTFDLGSLLNPWGSLYLNDTSAITFTSGGFATIAVTQAANALVFSNAISGYLFSHVIAPTANDGAALGASANSWSDLFLASGGVINFAAGDVTVTHASNALTFAGANSGYLFSHVIAPTANDAAALGTTGNSWSDLFLASGGVINFAAGDATVTHSTNTITFAGASSGYIFDAVIKPSANDGFALGVSGTAFADLFLASGGVINWDAGDVTLTHAANTLTFAGASSGYVFDAVIKPSANDGFALGVSGTAFADLFLASGAVINFNAGDVTVTHAADLLTVAGGNVALTNGTASNSTTTGTLQVTGGVGVTGQVTSGSVSIAGASLGGLLNITHDGAVVGAAATHNTQSAAGTHTAHAFIRNSVTVGSITTTLAATVYNTSSDKTLKEDGQLLSPKRVRDIIDNTEIWDFRWKHTGDRGVGVYAQDAYRVFPDAISPPSKPDEIWQADYSKYVPVLIAALQNANRRLDALEARH